MEQNNELSGLSNVGILRKLSACKTAEELCSVAAAEGKELTLQEAASLLEKLGMQSRELSDTELAAVAGGVVEGDDSESFVTLKCSRCGSIKRIVMVYKIGKEVYCTNCGVKHSDWTQIL